MSRFDFGSVKAMRLSAIVGQSIELKRAGRCWKGRCPFHDDRTPSFFVWDDRAFAKCFGCGWYGDAIDFITQLTGCSVRDAFSRLGAPCPVDRQPVVRRPSRENENCDHARAIWRCAVPIEGTPAQQYLWNRGINMPLRRTLRFARLKHPQGGIHPCLVALVSSSTGKFAAIQRTYVTDAGRKADVDPVKMSLGQISGGAIRLAPAAGELVVCEGLEDALTLQQELGQATWCAAGAGNLARMQFPEIVKSIVIGRDNDRAGLAAAEEAAAAFTGRGLKVRIMCPDSGFKDFNAQLRGVA